MSAAREIRRLRYLAAMGVPTYVCHRALPGAARPQRWALRPAPPAETRLVPETLAPADTPAVLKTATPTDNLLPRGRRPAPVDPAPNPTAAARPQDSALPVLRFRLAVVLVAGRLWLEDLGDEALARDQVQLIAALGRALEHPNISDAPPRVTQFEWPLHNNPQLDRGSEEATASLQSFLLRQIDDQPCEELMCLGARASTLLEHVELPCASRQLPASRDMLQNPDLKRQLWRDIRA